MDDEIGHGLKWSAISVLAVRVLQAARSLVIARAVGPKSVGSFAAAYAFVALASLTAEFGLQAFLIQRGAQARSDARAVGEIALIMGGVSSVALLLLARPIASFYGDSQISGLVTALVASVLLTSLMVVPNALLRAGFRFDTVARVSISAEFCATAVGIALAIAGAKVWALVAAALTSQCVTLAGLLLARPQWDRSPQRSKSDARRNAFRFGVSLTTGSTVWIVALQGDNVVVGRVLGATALGLYSFAYSYGIMPGSLIGSTVSDVALAGFSNARSDDERVSLLHQLLRVGAAAASPLVAISIAVAPAAVRLLLGSEWAGAARPLQILLIVGWLRGILPVESLLRSKGLVNAELKVGIVAAPATILAAYIGARGGLVPATVAVAVVLNASALVVTLLAIRSVGTNFGTVIGAVTPSVIVSALCASPLIVNDIWHIAPNGVAVVVLAPLCLATCVLSMRRWRPLEWQGLMSIVRSGSAVTSD